MRTVTDGAVIVPKREGRKAMEKQSTVQARQPWWLAVCWAVSGVGLDWYCAFEWFSGRYPVCSAHVLRVVGVFVLLYATVASLAVRLVGARLRDTAAVFLFISLAVSGAMLVHWAAHR